MASLDVVVADGRSFVAGDVVVDDVVVENEEPAGDASGDAVAAVVLLEGGELDVLATFC